MTAAPGRAFRQGSASAIALALPVWRRSRFGPAPLVAF
jgi:hypothetical protein